ncbi:MAG: TolC family protein [Vicinamibacterales bacterium]
MRQCTRSIALMLAALWAAPAAAQPAAPDPTALTLEAAFARAASANPVMAAARARQSAALAAVGTARERPNPELHVEYTRETPTQAYTLSLPVETSGKRARRIALGDAGVLVSGAEQVRTAFELRVAVRAAYFDLVAARARLDLLREVAQIATRAKDAAEQRFAAGDVARLEVLQADLARGDAENQMAAADGAAAAAAVRLRTLLAWPADTPLSLATSIDADVDRAVAAPGAAEPTRHADIAVLDAQVEEQKARIAVASSLRVPDLTPEVAVTRGAEPEFTTGWRAGLAVTLPIFTRHDAAVRTEEATLAAVTADRAATLARVGGDVAAASAQVEALAQQYRRYQSTLVPQAVEIERLADDAYRLGRTGIGAYLQALQASRDIRLRMLQTAADFQIARADLERALGAPLP